MIDYHMHSHISNDCSTPMRDMAAAAVQNGLKEICFTEHIDIDFPNVAPDECFVDFDAYDTALADVRKEFPALRIQKGIEAGLELAYIDQLSALLENKNLDFVIGSVHLVDREDPYEPSFWEKHNQRDAYIRYSELLLENAAAADFFDVMGHIGYIGKFCPHEDRMYRYDDFREITDELLRTLIAKGKGIEVNTGGTRMTPSTMPETDIVRRYFALGGEIITIGSDAHRIPHVGLAAAETLQTLADIGFKYICAFDQRKPRFISIH